MRSILKSYLIVLFALSCSVVAHAKDDIEELSYSFDVPASSVMSCPKDIAKALREFHGSVAITRDNNLYRATLGISEGERGFGRFINKWTLRVFPIYLLTTPTFPSTFTATPNPRSVPYGAYLRFDAATPRRGNVQIGSHLYKVSVRFHFDADEDSLRVEPIGAVLSFKAQNGSEVCSVKLAGTTYYGYL